MREEISWCRPVSDEGENDYLGGFDMPQRAKERRREREEEDQREGCLETLITSDDGDTYIYIAVDLDIEFVDVYNEMDINMCCYYILEWPIRNGRFLY